MLQMVQAVKVWGACLGWHSKQQLARAARLPAAAPCVRAQTPVQSRISAMPGFGLFSVLQMVQAGKVWGASLARHTQSSS